MTRRITAIIMLFTLALSASGCASMFEKEYLSVTEYRSDSQDEGNGTSIEVSSYYDLKNAITRLVNSHSEHGLLEFKNYEGSISSDLAKAFWEVKSETAYGAYAVDNMSQDISHIVSYYTADVHITYKYSKAVMDSIESVSGQAAITELIEAALESAQSNVLMRLASATVKAETVSEYVYEAYYSNPLISPVRPEASVNAYPESGFQRIFEVNLEYGYDPGRLGEMRQELEQALEILIADITAGTQHDMAFEACRSISELCAYNVQAEGPAVQPEQASLAGTAYGALVEKNANGEGFAMAYKAACDALGIECQVVLGRLDKIAHAWNIIRLGDSYFHVDVSQCAERGIGEAFLNDDASMWGRYWWDTGEYPSCEEAYGTFRTGDGGEEAAAAMSATENEKLAPEGEAGGKIGS